MTYVIGDFDWKYVENPYELIQLNRGVVPAGNAIPAGVVGCVRTHDGLAVVAHKPKEAKLLEYITEMGLTDIQWPVDYLYGTSYSEEEGYLLLHPRLEVTEFLGSVVKVTDDGDESVFYTVYNWLGHMSREIGTNMMAYKGVFVSNATRGSDDFKLIFSESAEAQRFLTKMTLDVM